MRPANQNDWISQIVKGKSFADVGGLWGTVNERISVASKGGASSLTMIDMQEKGNKWWVAFDARMKELGISAYKSVYGEATEEGFPDTVGRFDVVYCAGILYHLPSPYLLLNNLRKIANNYIILVSMTVPAQIRTPKGNIDLDGGKSLFCPSLSKDQRTILDAHFAALGIDTSVITHVPDEGWISPSGDTAFGPWWYLMTAEYILGLIRSLGLEVIDYGETWQNRATGFLIKVSH